jgi:hypothetical protein
MVDQIELKALLEAPEGTSSKNATLLTELAARYPYFQPLHLLLAKANIGQPNEKNSLATAALYTNGQLLHKVIFKADELKEFPIRLVNYPFNSEDSNSEDSLNEESPADLIHEEQPIAEIAEICPVEEEQIPLLPEESTITGEEIFEEIGEVDLQAYPLESPAMTSTLENPAFNIETVEEDFILENIVANDFFAFEKSHQPEILPTQPVNQEITTTDKIRDENNQDDEAPAEEDDSRISNYYDDKLPYTFLWWLEKTRKEHRSIFQPYAAPKNASQKSENSSDLQQQYVEHIFHIQSPFNPEEILNNNSELTHNETKEVELIDNFIKNAPQIGIPRAEQIDTENKARKSAEDHYDLVTETLAKIYIEQMLYHKAIDTYEKLSLKFPEKSRYFADLIQSIKKKI